MLAEPASFQIEKVIYHFKPIGNPAVVQIGLRFDIFGLVRQPSGHKSTVRWIRQGLTADPEISDFIKVHYIALRMLNLGDSRHWTAPDSMPVWTNFVLTGGSPMETIPR